MEFIKNIMGFSGLRKNNGQIDDDSNSKKIILLE